MTTKPMTIDERLNNVKSIIKKVNKFVKSKSKLDFKVELLDLDNNNQLITLTKVNNTQSHLTATIFKKMMSGGRERFVKCEAKTLTDRLEMLDLINSLNFNMAYIYNHISQIKTKK